MLQKSSYDCFCCIADHCLLLATVMLGICALIYYVFSQVNRNVIYKNKTFCLAFSLRYIVNCFASIIYFTLWFVFEQASFI